MSDLPLHRRLAILVLLLAAVLVLAFQGSRPLWEPDEGRFTNVALQMLHTGDFISLYRHHDSFHFTKPPVTYWAIAASVSALGWNEWAVRLPNALAWLGVVALLLRIGPHFAPKRPWLPALVYATLPFPLLAAHVVTTDTPLAFATTLAFACYVIARFESRPGFVVAMWAAFGLAFMSKGPPGLLGLLGILAFHLMHRGGPRLFPPLGLLLFAIVGLTWYGVVIARHEGLLAYFLGHEVIARIATDTHNRHPEWWGGFYVYGTSLALGTLPWWPWALGAARRIGLRWRNAAPETRLLLLWIGIAMLVFMLAQSRLPLYILPLFAPIALLFGRALQDTPLSTWRTIAIALVAGFVVFVKLVTAHKIEVAAWLPDRIGDEVSIHKDSRNWARELQAVLPFRPTEVVFVNDMARYGLHLYLGAEVEKIDFDGVMAEKPLSDAPFDDTVYDELREPKVLTRAFVMRPWAEERFVAMAAAAGWRAEKVGGVQDRVVYVLRPASR
ncbi:MAG TPA: glycosyltransferase [Xanthomonadaceae bacterium]|nr:glycosyltransferase [Xanthomonadaceae bacterium]